MYFITKYHSLFPPSSFPHSYRHLLRVAFFFREELYDIATFYINTLTNDLSAACTPVMQCLRMTDVITVTPKSLTFWSQPVSIFGCSCA